MLRIEMIILHPDKNENVAYHNTYIYRFNIKPFLCIYKYAKLAFVGISLKLRSYLHSI